MESFKKTKKKDIKTDKAASPDISNKQKDTSKTDAKKKSINSLKRRAQDAFKLIVRFQVPVIAILIGLLLGITALRMLSYSNPSASEEKLQENLSKFKKINIDPKIVERINQLSDSQAAPSTQIKDSRNNPFSE